VADDPDTPRQTSDAERDVRVPDARPRRRASVRSVILSLLGTMFTVVLFAAVLGVWSYSRVHAPGPLAEAKAVVIERGIGNEDVAATLEREGIVGNAREFLVLAWLTKATEPAIKAGEYAFPARVSMRDALTLMRAGRAITYKLTMPEGWTSERILERIRATPHLSGDITRAAPEGSLLPDTYLFQRGMSRDDLIAQMQAARDRLLADLWAGRAEGLPVKTPEEAVILASIVEKETGLAEERPRVAAVFLNRLRKRMRLQSDPTIIYGITGGKARLERPIRRSDIAEKTPYNTYQIDGLPPTPIANPGRDALAAVLNPQVTEDIYFVADGTGGHVFAATLKDHRANVKRWRQLERDHREADAEGEAAGSETAMDEPQKPSAEVDEPAPPPPDKPAPAPGPKAEAPVAVETPVVSEAPVAAEVPVVAEAPDTPEAPETPEVPVAAETLASVPVYAEIPAAISPGTVFRIAGRLVPFPRPRPPR
jgi:UPF0755 protein